MRIRGAKTELEDAGESTEGMAESTASLRAEMLALSGVDIMLNENEFKSTYQIMDELSNKWQNLSDIAQATIIELVAGKHQGNVFSSLMANFDIARDALDTSLNSSGSAMKEHAKWSESLEARLNKLKATWQSLSQTFMKSDFLKVIIDIAIKFIDVIDDIIDKVGVLPVLLGGFAGWKSFNKILDAKKMTQVGEAASLLTKAFPRLSNVIKALTGSTHKLSGAFKALFSGLSFGNWITIAIAAIGIGISLFDKYNESADELAERVENVTSKYKEQHGELVKLKGDYDTSKEDSLISKYGELSKGVNEFGENLSLTADEYAEYQSIVETIANQNPELVSGYNSQGDAILECAGDVDKLAESYQNLIKKQNEDVLKTGGDIFKDFKNDLKDTSAWYQTTNADGSGYVEHYDTKHLEQLQELMNLRAKDGATLAETIEETIASLTYEEAERISGLLDEYGIKRNVMFDGEAGWENHREHIIRALGEDKKEIKSILDEAANDLNVYAEDLGTVTSSYFNQAFLGGDSDLGIGDFSHFSERMQSVINNIASGFDSGFYAQFLDDENPYESLSKYLNSILTAFDGLSATQIGDFEAAFDLKTKFNGGEISYGEYVKGIQDAGKLVENLGLDDEVENQIKLALDTDEVVKNYDALKERLTSDKYNIQLKDEEAEKFLNELSASEYSVAIDLIPDEKIDFNKFKEYVEEQAKINEALNFKASIEVDKTALESLNTALSESASAMGLTSESISSLKAKYKDLDGYDAEALFERTANGVKINHTELAKLEKKYNDLNKSEVQKHLDSLVEAYNDNATAIDKCANASERAKLISKGEEYKSKIEELATYQAQLEGVTGAYQRWIDAQNTPEDYEGYKAVATGREDIKDEIGRGFISNASKEYIDLLSGEDLSGKNIDAYSDAWEKLDDKVTDAGYSINDFFTVNDDGDITAKGIDRFFKSVQTEFNGSIAKFDEETQKWQYNFSQENLEKIQKEWGIGIDAIELLLEAAASAGYDVDWDGLLDNIDLDTSNFETLVSAAESAQEAFNKLDGIEDVDFNFKATGVEEATTEIEKARSVYLDLVMNEDGTVNLKAKGAEQMRVILSTLLIQKQQLEDSNIAINIDTSGLDESQQDIANAIDAVKTFREKYKNLEIAVTTGQGIEDAKAELSTAMSDLQKLGGEGVNIAAQLMLGEGASADELKAEIDTAIASVGRKDITVGAQLDKTAVGNLNSQLLTNFTPEATVKITGIDDSLVNQYTSEEKTANGTVKWKNDESLVVQFQDKTHKASGIVDWANNIEKVKTKFSAAGTVTWTSGNNVKVNVISEAKGTANATGSAQSGHAFARGNWGIKGSGTALGGELGQELVVRDGKFFTVGDSGAEFFHYKPNDIIFNAAQTESLFKYGGIKGVKPRGKMLASGSAFVEGAHSSVGRAFPWSATASESNFAKNRVTGQSYGSKDSSSDKDKDFEEVIDWIEVIISRIERSINNFDKQANNIYKSWSSRNKALQNQISEVSKEIGIQQQAYDKYMEAASGVGLSSSWASKVRNGDFDINTITDEVLKEKITDYQTWYEKALACKDAIEDLKETESSLYAQRFENVQTQYDSILQGYEHTETMLNEYISQAEAKGHIVSKQYYDALIKNEKSNISELKKEQANLIKMRDDAVANEKIVKYSEEWYNMCAEIDSVTRAIEEGNTALIEYGKSMRDIDWEIFDLTQERISDVTEEADFLIELMSNKKLFEDNGKLTGQGLATMALHGQNYNTHMYQADEYNSEIDKLNKQIAKTPYDNTLIDRRNELLELQRESILAAEDEKNAIRDMVEEGINIELDALQELIDKKNEELESERDLYEYQKKVKEQTEEIASLEKQMAAYSGDDSEEAKQKVQQIKVDLETARQDLQETEWDKYISDTSAILDTLYNEYELILNTRLDNIDYLLQQVIDGVNASVGAEGTITSALGVEGAIASALRNNTYSIGEVLKSEVGNVGSSLSAAMSNIWLNDGSGKAILDFYGKDFQSKQTTTNDALNNIKADVAAMVDDVDKDAQKKVSENKTSTSAKKEPTKNTSTKAKDTTPVKNITNTTSSGDGKPKVGDKVKFVSGQYYYDSQGKKPLGAHNRGKEVYITAINTKSWATHPYHISTGSKLGNGDLGWLKLDQLSGYAAGKKNFSNDEIAWTQENAKENGKEFIVRPSDGAILTPIAKGDSVLTSAASNNIWDMANSPAEFIRDNLNLGTVSAPNNSVVQSNYTQHLDKVVFNLPNVKNYDELLAAMQKDKSFEKLIMAMTIDRIAGGSSLAKGKSIRR